MGRPAKGYLSQKCFLGQTETRRHAIQPNIAEEHAVYIYMGETLTREHAVVPIVTVE